ncbi:MAG: hypothetical protein WBX25_05405 [Rhodomicrobium sp.]
MNGLAEKPEEGSGKSCLSDQLSESAAELSKYIGQTAEVTLGPFGSDSSVKYDDSEPLPFMTTFPTITPPRRHTPKAIAGLPLFVVAAVFLSLAAREGAHLATWSYSLDRAAVKPAAAQADHGQVAVIAPLSSFPSADDEEPQPQLIAAAKPTLAQDDSWPETVETFRQLLAAKKASQLGAWEARTEQ